MTGSAGSLTEYAELEKALADPGVHADQERARALGKRYAELSPVVNAYQDWQRTTADERPRARAVGRGFVFRGRGRAAAGGTGRSSSSS